MSKLNLFVSIAITIFPVLAFPCGLIGGFTHSGPRDGEVWPAGAPVVLFGEGLEFNELEATVDGAPVRLRRVEGPGHLNLMLDPAAEEGAAVRVGSGSKSLNFTVGPEQNPSPLEAPTGVEMDVHDFAGGGSGCSAGDTHAIHFRANGGLPLGQWIEFSVHRSVLPRMVAGWRDEVSAEIVIDERYGGGDPVHGCGQVQVVDYTGARSEAVRICGAGRVLRRPLTEHEMASHVEDWSQAVPGPGARPDETSGCSVGFGGGPAPWGFGLFALLALRRRRSKV